MRFGGGWTPRSLSKNMTGFLGFAWTGLLDDYFLIRISCKVGLILQALNRTDLLSLVSRNSSTKCPYLFELLGYPVLLRERFGARDDVYIFRVHEELKNPRILKITG